MGNYSVFWLCSSPQAETDYYCILNVTVISDTSVTCYKIRCSRITPNFCNSVRTMNLILTKFLTLLWYGHWSSGVVTPCGLVGRFQRFGGTYCLHFQNFTAVRASNSLFWYFQGRLRDIAKYRPPWKTVVLFLFEDRTEVSNPYQFTRGRALTVQREGAESHTVCFPEGRRPTLAALWTVHLSCLIGKRFRPGLRPVRKL
jgi:hypothetical protein